MPIASPDSSPRPRNHMRSYSHDALYRLELQASSASTSSIPSAPVFPDTKPSIAASDTPFPKLQVPALLHPPTRQIRKKSGEIVKPSLKSSPSVTTTPLHSPEHVEAEPNQSDIINSHHGDSSSPSPDYPSPSPNCLRLVRKPAKSAPATPTIIPQKAVHFDTKLEHVRLFLAQQRPAAVSRDGSPDFNTETEEESEYPFPTMDSRRYHTTYPSPDTCYDLHLANFGRCPPTNNVVLTKLELVDVGVSKGLRGFINVSNLAFEKRVVVRFTLDDWQTVSEISADYNETILDGQKDVWTFTIRSLHLYSRSSKQQIILAIRYETNGEQFWDNNGGENYVVHVKSFPLPKSKSDSLESRSSKFDKSAPKNMLFESSTNRIKQQLNRILAGESDSDSEAEEDNKANNKISQPRPTVRLPAASKSSVLTRRYDFGSALNRTSSNHMRSQLYFAPSSNDSLPSSMSRTAGELMSTEHSVNRDPEYGFLSPVSPAFNTSGFRGGSPFHYNGQSNEDPTGQAYGPKMTTDRCYSFPPANSHPGDNVPPDLYDYFQRHILNDDEDNTEANAPTSVTVDSTPQPVLADLPIVDSVSFPSYSDEKSLQSSMVEVAAEDNIPKHKPLVDPKTTEFIVPLERSSSGENIALSDKFNDDMSSPTTPDAKSSGKNIAGARPSMNSSLFSNFIERYCWAGQKTPTSTYKSGENTPRAISYNRIGTIMASQPTSTDSSSCSSASDTSPILLPRSPHLDASAPFSLSHTDKDFSDSFVSRLTSDSSMPITTSISVSGSHSVVTNLIPNTPPAEPWASGNSVTSATAIRG